jgi:septal ring factor EnvC (AmiA/AmiB activator)
MNSFLSGLHEKRSQKADLIDATLNRAAEENRDISEVETANVAALAKEIEKLDERIAQVTDIEVRKDAAAELAKTRRRLEGRDTSNIARPRNPRRAHLSPRGRVLVPQGRVRRSSARRLRRP